MDDVYEFENSEYRLATMQIKAIAYDVVTGITRKKLSLKNVEKGDEMTQQLAIISDKIVELTDALEQELEKLDRIEETVKSEFSTQEEEPSNDISKPRSVAENKSVQTSNEMAVQTNNIEVSAVATVPKKESTSSSTQEPSEENMSSQKMEVKENEVPANAENKEPEKEPYIPEMPSLGMTTIKEVAVTPSEQDSVKAEEKNNPEVENSPTSVHQDEKKLQDLKEVSSTEVPQLPEIQPPTSQQEVPSASIEKEEPSNLTAPLRKIFQKMTKNLSKAIMVRPNQLENLKKSRKYQEQILTKQGVFSNTEETTEEQNPINQAPKELPSEIERQIEDLTVKANIYYNEGEIDQAQELYDQIKKLNEQYR